MCVCTRARKIIITVLCVNRLIGVERTTAGQLGMMRMWRGSICCDLLGYLLDARLGDYMGALEYDAVGGECG